MVLSKRIRTFVSHYNFRLYMPTIFILFGYIFKFYSDDHEPIHVHVIKDNKEAKYNVSPEVVQVFNHGFKKHEISIIEGVIEENVEVIVDRWKSFFDKENKYGEKA